MIGAAIKVAKIATGEDLDELRKESAAAELGRKGGQARAKKLNTEQCAEIARTAARKRWKK